jgi:tRNA dimethylallyltransferase
MVERGLLDELDRTWRRLQALDRAIDPTRGVCQAIGFKEFLDYLQLKSHNPSDLEGQQRAWGRGVEALKRNTRRYARKQVAWIQNRLAPHFPVFSLEVVSTDWNLWVDSVLCPALELVTTFLTKVATLDRSEAGEENGEDELWQDSLFALQRVIPKQEPVEPSERHARFRCDVCAKDLIGRAEWDAHCSSKAHRHHSSRLRKQQSEPRKRTPRERKPEEPEVQEVDELFGSAQISDKSGEVQD